MGENLANHHNIANKVLKLLIIQEILIANYPWYYQF